LPARQTAVYKLFDRRRRRGGPRPGGLRAAAAAAAWVAAAAGVTERESSGSRLEGPDGTFWEWTDCLDVLGWTG